MYLETITLSKTSLFGMNVEKFLLNVFRIRLAFRTDDVFVYKSFKILSLLFFVRKGVGLRLLLRNIRGGGRSSLL